MPFKLILSFGISLIIGLNSFSMGAVWVLEIEYSLNDSALLTGYIDASYRIDPFIYDNGSKGFLNELNKRYGSHDSLVIFDQLIDNERLAELASFPMHSFHLVKSSGKKYSVQNLSNVKKVRIWKKDEYWIEVLTKMNDSDTTWIDKKSEITYPIGNDVGCRIEVHKLGATMINEDLLQEFIVLYRMDTPRSHQNQGRFHQILALLKDDRIVLVELCGC